MPESDGRFKNDIKMNNQMDILQEISLEDILHLRDLFKNGFPRYAYIYNFLNSTVKWKIKYPENYITILVPHGNWKTGTFVVVHQFHCYEVYMFTLEESCEILYEAIVSTRKVDWEKEMLIYALLMDHYPMVLSALHKTQFKSFIEIPCSIWWMPVEKAIRLNIDCPSEVYITKLEAVHAITINAHWPHKYPGSEKFLAFIIEANGGFGIFLKSNNDLVAWILRIQIGLGTLQVVEEYKRRGYGSLVTKVLTKEIASEGTNPTASILNNNVTSQAMFSKIGFKNCASVMYLESKEYGIK